MKELQTHLDVSTKTELNVKKKKEIEHILIGSIKPKKGHIIYEVYKNGTVKPASFKRNVTAYLGDKITDRLIINEGCVYIPAMNAENALKKYSNDNRQSAYYPKQPLFNLNDIP